MRTNNNWVEGGEGRYRKQESWNIRSGSSHGFVPSEIIYLVRTQELPKDERFNFDTHIHARVTRGCAYKKIKNVSFTDIFANVRNE